MDLMARGRAAVAKGAPPGWDDECEACGGSVVILVRRKPGGPEMALHEVACDPEALCGEAVQQMRSDQPAEITLTFGAAGMHTPECPRRDEPPW
jgi:hypothetical protein